MPWREICPMEEKTRFIAAGLAGRRKHDGGAVRRVWDQPQDRLQVADELSRV